MRLCVILFLFPLLSYCPTRIGHVSTYHIKERELRYIEKIVPELRDEFTRRVIEISDTLGVDPNWSMVLMNSESGLKSNAKNRFTGAYGLFQLTPGTAKHMKVDFSKYKDMNQLQQLEVFLQYFIPFKNRMHSFVDMYLCCFYPMGGAVMRIQGDYIFPKSVCVQNKSFDIDKDGVLHLWEVRNYMRKKI